MVEDFYEARTRVLEKLASMSAASCPRAWSPELGPDATALGQVFWYTVEGPVRTLVTLRSIQDFDGPVRAADRPGRRRGRFSVGGMVREYQVDVDPNLPALLRRRPHGRRARRIRTSNFRTSGPRRSRRRGSSISSAASASSRASERHRGDGRRHARAHGTRGRRRGTAPSRWWARCRTRPCG